MLKKLNRYWLPALIWFILLIFSYFGEYPYFILNAFQGIEVGQGLIVSICEELGLNSPDAAWWTARVSFSILLVGNYFLMRMVFGSRSGNWFFLIGMGLIVLSILSSLLGLADLRTVTYQATSFMTNPIFILICIPIRSAYRRLENSEN